MHQQLGQISQQYSRQHFKKRQEQWIYCMLDLTVHKKIKETQTLTVELLSSRVEKDKRPPFDMPCFIEFSI